MSTTDRDRAEQSRWTWGSDDGDPPYCLTLLGILHTLTGLVVEVVE